MVTKGEKRQQEILDAARAVLIERGYEGFVLREIAAELGITVGNLQYYFPTREDLLLGVGRAENQRALDAILRITLERASPTEKIRRLVREVVDGWHREGGKVFAALTLLAIHNPQIRALYMENYQGFYDALADVLAELEPRSSRDALVQKARLVTSLLDGALLQIPIHRNRTRRKELDEFLAELGDAVLRLLGHEE